MFFFSNVIMRNKVETERTYQFIFWHAVSTQSSTHIWTFSHAFIHGSMKCCAMLHTYICQINKILYPASFLSKAINHETFYTALFQKQSINCWQLIEAEAMFIPIYWIMREHAIDDRHGPKWLTHRILIRLLRRLYGISKNSYVYRCRN